MRLFLRSSGLPAPASQTILRRAGILASELDTAELRVDEQQFTRFLILLSRRTRDEAWGLASNPVPLGTFHTLCRLIVNCRTLGEALGVVGRFYRLVVSDFAIKLRRDDNQAIVWLKPLRTLEAERYVSLHGAALFLLYQFMCWLVDRRLPLLAASFSYPRRPSSAEPLRAYDTRVIEFEQRHTELRLEDHLMSLPIIGGEDRLNRFLSAAPRALITRYYDESRVSDRVKSILRTQVGVPLGLNDVAARLHMTPVTLRRHLAEEGCRRFSELRDDVRRRAALDMVRQKHVKLETVALRLGFSEYSTFHRAFRRWTGIGPTEFREHPPAD
ncbi:AraC family transcriptional regulator [Verticiella sediminum]|uniref:AraC family transcriptional regulator n=1 Tax=Verticiella sediminum TaxID=1247510 RepID=UPI0014788866|nr:AraC family transcriptional regulator [Verticiella sediminum]